MRIETRSLSLLQKQTPEEVTPLTTDALHFFGAEFVWRVMDDPSCTSKVQDPGFVRAVLIILCTKCDADWTKLVEDTGKKKKQVWE